MKPFDRRKWCLIACVVAVLIATCVILFAMHRIDNLNNTDIRSVHHMARLERWRSELRFYHLLHVLNNHDYHVQSQLLLQQEAWLFESRGNTNSALHKLNLVISGNAMGDETPFISKYRILVRIHRYTEAVTTAQACRSMLQSTNEKDYSFPKGDIALTYALEAYAYRMSGAFSNAFETLVLANRLLKNSFRV